MSRFLLATWDGGGVVTAELALAGELVRRGHDVLVLADDTVEGDAAASGSDFRPWTTAPHARARDRRRALVRDWETRNPLSDRGNIGSQLFFGPAAHFAADTAAAVREWEPDVVMSDAFLGGVLAAAEASGRPVAALAPNVNMLRAPGVPALGGGFHPPRGMPGRVRDRVVRRVTDVLMDLHPLNEARQSLGLRPVADMDDMVRRADLVLLLTSAAFDFGAPARAGSVVYGGIPVPPPAPPWSPPWSDDGRPAVLVALGSTYQHQEATLDRVVAALGDLRCHAVVTLGRGLAGHHPATVPPNVHLVDELPHDAVFPHVDLCISHGGHGTVVRSLAAGVPLVIVPMGRDQADNAARALHLGAAHRLGARSSVVRMRSAVAGALLDARLAEGALRAAQLLSAELGAAVAVDELEALARRRP